MGERDKHTSLEKTKLYGETMKKNGNHCEVIIYPGQKHGFFNLQKGGKEYFSKTLIAADNFLVSQNLLKGDEMVEAWFTKMEAIQK